MAIRDDVVQSAVKFLKDPKVQQAPLARRVAFLETKGLTTEEIEEAMSRSGTSGSATTATTSAPSTSAPATTAVQPAPAAAYNPANPYAPNPAAYQPQQPYYPQQPGYPYPSPYPVAGAPYPPYGQPGFPAEVPPRQRDWRDYTLGAIGAVAGAYAVGMAVKKWVLPYLTSPATTTLSADRQLVSENLATTASALEAVQQEAAAVVKAVEGQADRVGAALEAIDKAVREVRESDAKREEEMKGLRDDLENIKTMLPKMVEKQKEAHSAVLTDLQTEIKSLKSLLLNRRIGPLTAPADPDDGLDSGAASSAGGVAQPLPVTSKYLQAKPSIPAWQLEQQKRAEETQKKREAEGQGAGQSAQVGDG